MKCTKSGVPGAHIFTVSMCSSPIWMLSRISKISGGISDSTVTEQMDMLGLLLLLGLLLVGWCRY